VLPLTLLAGIADSLRGTVFAGGAVAATVAGILALAAGLLHTVRLAGWRGSLTVREPILVILHIGYAWLAAGYLLIGASALGLPLPPTAALHALTMGAAGVMIFAVATRVALGHTGRPLVVAAPIVVAYGILNLAVALRVLGPVLPGNDLALVDLAATGWVVAFGLLLVVYWPILTRPRPDGR
jgi:uncharacterized protein involved in response to NO